MRARPIFTTTLVASALALPAPAFALALGKLTVDSALGQPLSARIELAAATRDEIESLSAKVADPSLYRQNNLTYQGVLSRTRINVERTPDGTRGAAGHLAHAGQRALPRPDGRRELGNRPRGARVHVPARSAGAAVARPTSTRSRLRGKAPLRPPRPQHRPRRRRRGAPAPAAAPGDGYIVRRGDTLSRIAQQYKPADVTLEQMLVAMFNANTGAFDGNNMNRLRTGAIVTRAGRRDREGHGADGSLARRARAGRRLALVPRSRRRCGAERGRRRRARSGRTHRLPRSKIVRRRRRRPRPGPRVARSGHVGRGGAAAAEADRRAEQAARGSATRASPSSRRS